MQITRNRLRILFATVLTLAGAGIAYFAINRMLAAHTVFGYSYGRPLGVGAFLLLAGVSLYFEFKSDVPAKKPWEDET